MLLCVWSVKYFSTHNIIYIIVVIGNSRGCVRKGHRGAGTSGRVGNYARTPSPAHSQSGAPANPLMVRGGPWNKRTTREKKEKKTENVKNKTVL